MNAAINISPRWSQICCCDETCNGSQPADCLAVAGCPYFILYSLARAFLEEGGPSASTVSAATAWTCGGEETDVIVPIVMASSSSSSSSFKSAPIVLPRRPLL